MARQNQLGSPTTNPYSAIHPVPTSLPKMVPLSNPRIAAPQFVKVRCDRQDPGYVLSVSYPDGSQRIERFDDAQSLLEGSIRLQKELIRDGWQPCQQPPSQDARSFFVRFRHFPKRHSA